MINDDIRIWDRFNYYTDKLQSLKESPIRSGDFDSFDYEEGNPSALYKIVMNPERGYKKIHSQYHQTNNVTVDLYQKDDGGGDFDIKIVTDKLDEVIGHISYTKINDGGIEINSVYNQPLFKGLIFKIYFDYFLEEYPYIMSGSIHSKKGETFWERIIDTGLNNGFKCYVLNVINKEKYDIKNIFDVKPYYNSEHNRIVISKS